MNEKLVLDYARPSVDLGAKRKCSVWAVGICAVCVVVSLVLFVKTVDYTRRGDAWSQVFMLAANIIMSLVEYPIMMIVRARVLPKSDLHGWRFRCVLGATFIAPLLCIGGAVLIILRPGVHI